MPRQVSDPGGGGTPGKGILRPKAPKKVTAPKKGTAGKARNASGGTAKKAATPKAKSSGTFQEAVGAGGGKQTGGIPAGGHLAGSAQVALELADLSGGAVSGAGLGDVLLDLVGEGRILLSHALQAWQREQDRVANRAWRRPGGMARMGGV
jgi:hypothetical protein